MNNKTPEEEEKLRNHIKVMLRFKTKYKKYKAIYENDEGYICLPILEEGQEPYAIYCDKETRTMKEIKIADHNPKDEIEKSVIIDGEDFTWDRFYKDIAKVNSKK